MKKVMFTVMFVFMLEVLVGCSAVFMADRLAANGAEMHQMVTMSQTNSGN